MEAILRDLENFLDNFRDRCANTYRVNKAKNVAGKYNKYLISKRCLSKWVRNKRKRTSECGRISSV